MSALIRLTHLLCNVKKQICDKIYTGARGIVSGIASLPGGIVTIIIDALIIYYFTRPYVKKFFGI